METLERFGVSIPADLLQAFDRLIARQGYPSRSEALRDLIRERLIEEKWNDENETLVGTVTIVYDHDKRSLADDLVDAQHEYHRQILSGLHVHLDEHHCLEVVAVRGTRSQLEEIASRLLSAKGVQHGKLVYTLPEKQL
ncbi:MAG: nickel-responsive transcriptional regulator NikR [Armatimonadetes bacterium]|nr:nickel-responsive transcriptional regulator NikR [Armatimonadota bacterium]